MKLVLGILVYGAIQSGVYAILALGFSLIFGVAGVVNLSHTMFYMVGAYLIYTFTNLMGLGLYFSLLLSIVGVGIIALIVQQLLHSPTS